MYSQYLCSTVILQYYHPFFSTYFSSLCTYHMFEYAATVFDDIHLYVWANENLYVT